MILFLMGVSGSGKSTIGHALAERTGMVFADGDDYHPAANKIKMAAGHPLDDNDRAPWLMALNELARGWQAEGRGGIIACSALKQSYREMLMRGLPEGSVAFVLLSGSQELIASRLAARHHEFMSPTLLESQLKTLELPSDALQVINDRPPAEVADQIIAQLSLPTL
jgi:gluconokinase